MGGQPVELGEDDADVIGPRRRFDVEQLLHRLAVAQPVGDRGHIIHAIHVGIEHGVGAVRRHVKDRLVGVEEGVCALVQVEVGGGGLGGIAHWPLSIPRLICTHSWSCWMMLWSLRKGKPFQSSGKRMRRRSGWPSKRMPNMS